MDAERALTLGELLGYRAALTPNHTAMVLPGVRVTYAELSQRADDVAAAMVGLGVAAGQHVGLFLPPSVDYVATMFGVARAGAVPVLMNNRFKARELRHVITNGDLELVLTSGSTEGMDFAALLHEALPGLEHHAGGRLALEGVPRLHHCVLLDATARTGFLGNEHMAAAATPEASAAVADRQAGLGPDDIGLMMYTSGTTAAPKGAMLRHGALTHQAYAVPETRFMMTSDDVVWSPLPLFHIGGISYVLQCIAVGATVVHLPYFDADTAVAQLIDEQCTIALPAFETIWLQVLDHQAASDDALSALRLVLAVGIPERLEQMQQRLPEAPMVTTFGGTESTSHLSIALADDPPEVRLRTGGHPLPGIEVRICDAETGADLPPGTAGEIVYRGWNRFVGYYNEPELTAQVIDADGWFHSGDLGTIDDDGRVSYVGRIKDMLKVGGENVAAAEIEAFLVDHPAVQIVQVVSAPDARYTEVAAAYVELKAGATATEQELIDHCRGRIATFKVPRYVRFVEQWPMSGTKIKKYVLRQTIAAELSDKGIAEAPKVSST